MFLPLYRPRQADHESPSAVNHQTPFWPQIDFVIAEA
jgi:hypothetical protein